MNKKLKSTIIEKFGTQADFAHAVQAPESLVSRVVRYRHFLSPERQAVWAKILKCKPEKLFSRKGVV